MAFSDGKLEPGGVGLDVIRHLAARRIAPAGRRKRPARQAVPASRAEQLQRIPAASPLVADPVVRVHDEERPAALREVIAGSQPRLTGADDQAFPPVRSSLSSPSRRSSHLVLRRRPGVPGRQARTVWGAGRTPHPRKYPIGRSVRMGTAREPRVSGGHARRRSGGRRRDDTSSFVKMLLTCRSIVRSLIPRSAAIARLVLPTASRRSTSTSLTDKPSVARARQRSGPPAGPGPRPEVAEDAPRRLEFQLPAVGIASPGRWSRSASS